MRFAWDLFGTLNGYGSLIGGGLNRSLNDTFL